MSSSHAIEARGLGKTFGDGKQSFRALDNVSLKIRRNEFFTLLGPSGCGKTTLLRLIAGFEYPSEGTLLLDGSDLAALPPYRRPVNTVFQNYALFPHMSVAENIAFGLSMLKKPKADIARRVDETLALVRMDSLRDRATSEISGGQQQRVALARALAPSPEVLLLDEPLSALDYKLRKEMQIELKRMQEQTGITFIFVTHDQEEALTMSDRIAVMSAGRILQTGSPHDIYERPADRFVASFIGESNFLEGRLIGIDGERVSVELDAGGELIATRPAPSNASTAGGDDTTSASSQPVLADRVSLVVRPEHATIVDDTEQASLRGALENIVYSGTDTHFHVRLANDQSFTVRTQNRRGGEVAFKAGQAIGIRVQEAAAQLLRD